MEINPNRDNVVTAVINTINCTDTKTTVQVFVSKQGHLTSYRNSSFFRNIFGDRLLYPRSFTLIYAHNNTRSRNRIISLGQRQPNDKLLQFESKLVKVINRFAEDDFQYENETRSITKITFSFDVSVIERKDSARRFPFASKLTNTTFPIFS